MNWPQHKLGSRAKADWGMSDLKSEHVVGDIFYIPPDCPSALDKRTGTGIYRIESVFSIDTPPNFYYRVCPVEIKHGNRLRTDWGNPSDRCHVIEELCDYTYGWVKLWEQPELEDD